MHGAAERGRGATRSSRGRACALSLSISAGPARFPDDGRTFDELLAVADERMYRDKAVRRSRNVTRHSAAVAKSELA